MMGGREHAGWRVGGWPGNQTTGPRALSTARSLGRVALRASLVAVAVLAAQPPTRLSAQSAPQLVAAVKLAQDGQGDSARADLRRMLDATPTGDTLYPQILYT